MTITKEGKLGMDSAAQHAGQEWGESADHYLRWFARIQANDWHGGKDSLVKWRFAEKGWTMEECRLWSYSKGLAPALSERAWGSVTQRALRSGVIVGVGYSPTRASNGACRRTYRAA